MGEGFLRFACVQMKKKEFHYSKSSVDIGDVGDVNIDKFVISDKFPSSKKGSGCMYFVGYKKKEKITPMSVLLPRMIGYPRNFNAARVMNFLIKECYHLNNFFEEKTTNTHIKLLPESAAS